MARRGMRIDARLTITGVASVLVAAALLGWLAITSIDRELEAALRPDAGPTVRSTPGAPPNGTRRRLAPTAATSARRAGSVARFQGRTYAGRIAALVRSTEAFVSGRPVAGLADEVGDELTVLSGSVRFMTEHLSTV